MWGLGVYFVHLADYLLRRGYDKRKLKTCDVCRKNFESAEGMEKHRRDSHPNVPPREASASGVPVSPGFFVDCIYYTLLVSIVTSIRSSWEVGVGV